MQQPSTDASPVHIVRVRTTSAFGRAFATALELSETSMVSWDLDDRSAMTFESYFCARDDAERFAQQIEKLLQAISHGETWQLSIEQAQPCNWQEEWKRFFHVKRISPRIVIRPAWEHHEPKPGEIVITMEPGMSFGTGQHGTTSACLRMLDDISGQCRGLSFLDMGCGTGILSIAASRLGFSPLLAIDHDPLAVETCRKNCAANQCGDVQTRVMDVGAAAGLPPHQVVVANILAEVLIRQAPQIADCVSHSHDSRLILAGILHEQFKRVEDVYNLLGFVLLSRDSEDEWTSGMFKRTTAD